MLYDSLSHALDTDPPLSLVPSGGGNGAAGGSAISGGGSTTAVAGAPLTEP